MAEIRFEPPELVLRRAWKAANEERARRGLRRLSFVEWCAELERLAGDEPPGSRA